MLEARAAARYRFWSRLVSRIQLGTSTVTDLWRLFWDLILQTLYQANKIFIDCFYTKPNIKCGGFSSPEMKGEVSFSDHLLSVVCPPVCLHTFHVFMFFSRATGLISTKHSSKYPYVKGVKICSSEGPCLTPRGNNYEIAKKHWQILTKFCKNHPSVREI